MNAQQLVPLMMAFNTPARERQQMLQLMLPSLLDLDRDLQPLLGGLAGKQLLRRCRQRERRVARDLVRELHKAFRILAEKGKVDDVVAQNLPMIHRMGLLEEVKELLSEVSGQKTKTAPAAARGGARKG
jgi:hypothetical protein